MTGTFWIRTVGMLTCMVAVVSGWDAEAARCHRRASCCCEPVCCEPVRYERACCETVRYEPACCERVCVSTVRVSPCCVVESDARVIRETVIVPARPCCDGATVVSEAQAPASAPAVLTTRTAPQAGSSIVKTALSR